MEEVLKAVKTLGEYCSKTRCGVCIFKADGDVSNCCLFNHRNPQSMAMSVSVETKTVYNWEDK